MNSFDGGVGGELSDQNLKNSKARDLHSINSQTVCNDILPLCGDSSILENFKK